MFHKQESNIGSENPFHIFLFNEIKRTLIDFINLCVAPMWLVERLSTADIKKEISSLDLSFIGNFY